MPLARVHLLVSGRVQVHKTTPDGREVVIKVLAPGEVFAEVILFEIERYPATATAIAESLVLRVAKRDFHRLLDQPGFRNDFIVMLMQKQRYLAERIGQVTSQSVEERFFAFLREQGFKRLDFEGDGPINAFRSTTAIFYRPDNCLGI